MCPISGTNFRRGGLVACGMCQQSVSPLVLYRGSCQVCRTLSPVGEEDTSFARLVGEFPRLERWSAWRMGESKSAYVLTAGAFLRRLLVVIQKEPLEIVRVASATRWIGGWAEAPDDLRRELESRSE